MRCSNSTFSPRSRAGLALAMISWSSALSKLWFCFWVQNRPTAAGISGWCRMRDRSSPLAFQWAIAWRLSSLSTRPTISVRVRKPSFAMILRSSSATK
jgi:hypothetical protein